MLFEVVAHDHARHAIYQTLNGSLHKTDSRNVCFAKSAKRVLSSPLFNHFFKNNKIMYVFVTIRKECRYNWTRVWYTFVPMKYRPSKRFGNLRIKSQIVRVIVFCLKVLLARGGDSRLLTLYISVARSWIFLSLLEAQLCY